MKKIKFLVLLFSFAFFSCEEATDVLQDGEISDAVTFTNTDNMKLYLSETYDKLMTSGTLNEIALSAIVTDEVGVGRNGNAFDTYRNNITLTNGYSSQIWLDYYTTINYCNRLLRGSLLVTPTSAADQVIFNDIIAQTRAIRAYSYTQLLTYFSTDMKNDNALGVILLDRVSTTLEKLPRNINSECYALIESDLAYADANIQPVPVATVKSWAYVSKSMVNALRARLYAYRGNYALAETYATAAISNSGLSLTDGTVYTTPAAFFLATGSNNDYKRMFQDSPVNGRGEVIWCLGRAINKQAIVSSFFVNASSLSGISTFDMNRNLFNILDNGGAPWDIRRRVNIDPTAVIDLSYLTSTNYQSTDALVLDKYSGISTSNLINDIKVFRISEMLLIKAEGRANAMDYSGVATILKQIRDKRSTTGARPLPVYANATEAWADILLERRLELCFEGHRYIDLKRLGVLANKTVDRHPLDNSTYNITGNITSVTDFRFTLPIPSNEIAGNPTIQQNPGY